MLKEVAYPRTGDFPSNLLSRRFRNSEKLQVTNFNRFDIGHWALNLFKGFFSHWQSLLTFDCKLLDTWLAGAAAKPSDK